MSPLVAAFHGWCLVRQSGAPGRVNVNVVPLPGSLLDVDLAPVGRDDLADDRQAQPAPPECRAVGDPIELLEEPRQVLGRDPLAVVLRRRTGACRRRQSP